MLSTEEIYSIVRNGTLEELESLLAKYPGIQTTEHEKTREFRCTSLIQMAISIQDVEKVALLIKRGAIEFDHPRGLLLDWVYYSQYLCDGTTLDLRIVKELAEAGFRFSYSKGSNRRAYNDAFRGVLTDDRIDILDALVSHGFSPLELERISEQSFLYDAISLVEAHLHPDMKVAHRLIELGCDIEGGGHKYNNPFLLALRYCDHYRSILLTLVKLGVDRSVVSDVELLETLADQVIAVPSTIEVVVGEEVDLNAYFEYGTQAIHDCSGSGNIGFLTYLLDRGVDINSPTKHEGDTPLIVAATHKQKAVLKILIETGADLDVMNKQGNTALDIAYKQNGFKQGCALLEKAGAKISAELNSGEDGPQFGSRALASVDQGEPWADAFRDHLAGLDQELGDAWHNLFRHVLSTSSTKPSKKWTKTAEELVVAAGEKRFREYLLQVMPLIKEMRTNNESLGDDYYYEGDSRMIISDNNTRLLRGLFWLLARFNDDEVCSALRDVAKDMYTKVYGVGMRNAKIANAAIYSLSTMPGDIGVKELITLRATTKYNPALVNINRVFSAVAKERKVSVEELAEVSVSDYGLQDFAVYKQTLADIEATATLSAVGKTELTWAVKDKVQKTVPAAIKRDHADELKILKKKVKDLNLATSAHALRIEQQYINGSEHSIGDWRSRYMEHKLVGFIARRLIWTVTTKTESTSVFWRESGFVDVTNKAVKIPIEGTVRLWHPSQVKAAEVLAWRNWLIEQSVVQPFKQAHREVYILTDAERKTNDHSLRFANHILRQSQFHALATQRGWKQQRGGSWDGGSENSAYKHIAAHNLDVEFIASGVEEYGSTMSGIYEYVGTRAVVFYKKDEEVSLSTIDPLLFSELMRDVDLFVGVCSAMNDPTWADTEAFVARELQSPSDLSESVKTRQSVLTQLIPKLGIAEKLSLEGRYLEVEGTIRKYKIHVGSSNILMMPNNQYLCIVPKRTKNTVALPFEGDYMLSLILSKAFTLVDDHKIKDSTILSQIKE